MKRLLVLLLLSASPAFAQQLPPAPQPSAPDADCGCGSPENPRGPR